MEGSGGGSMSPARVKEEPPGAVTDHVVKEEAESLDEEEWVKTEPSWSDSTDSCGVSEAAALAGLYTDHIVKDEIVLGPERLHRPDVGLLVIDWALANADGRPLSDCAVSNDEGRQPAPRDTSTHAHIHSDIEVYGRCSVRLERLLLDAERRTCRVGRREYTLHASEPTVRSAPKAPFYQCHHCDKRFTRKTVLKKHLDAHSSSAPPRNSTPAGFDPGHCKQVLLKDDKPFQCSHCDYKCSRQYHLRTHQIIHTDEKPFECNQCDFKCKFKANLQSHKMIHTGEQPFQCSHCDFKCNRKSSLRSHQMLHTGEKPFQCTHCDYKCNLNSNLRRHEAIHTGEKPFQCSHCDYKCAEKSYIKIHLMIHTGEKPFGCDQCDYKCISKKNLRIHVKKHSGHKPFQCKQESSLKKHQTIHTCEKPFQCSHCDYKCNRKSILKKHQMIHTGEKPFQCSHCDYKCNLKSSLKNIR